MKKKETDQELHRRLNAERGKKKGNNNNNNKNNGLDSSLKQPQWKTSPTTSPHNSKKNANQIFKGPQTEHFKQVQKVRQQQNKVRAKCTCQATKHELVGNCLQCGRVVCDKEGAGLCLFCGIGYVGNAKTKSEKKIRDTSMDVDNTDTAQFERAIDHKNRILKYDKENTQRTAVIDDENDYFETDSRWISQAEREKRRNAEFKMNQEKDKMKRSNIISIDLVNKTVNKEDAMDIFDPTKYYPENNKNEEGSKDGPPEIVVNVEDMKFGADVHPDLRDKPTFVSMSSQRIDVKRPEKRLRSRIQDDSLSKMVDHGKCMSMHQPWASLLVCGIKTVEGRSWYSSHRGRLWIAATSQPADPEAVRDVEAQYRSLYDDPDMEFPKVYPTSCLLGCVDVVDCMTNEDYKEQYQSEESQSDYVFVCENPQTLPIKFSISGDHKIWNLDRDQHMSARTSLMVNR